ncbi:hypothetical protein QQ045_020922 [Rhodiola kirilowii]
MVYEPKSPPSEPVRDGSEEGIDLGLGLGLGANFDAEMRKYKEKIFDDRRKKMKVSMGFTDMQRMELEQQARIFNYIQSGLQVPYPILYPVWKSVARSIDCSNFPFIPNLMGGSVGLSWMGSSDPEPGRCKRTDGKKWRCAKEALPNHKYCERHLHRGRRRSRKLVESSFVTPPLASSSSPERISLSIALPGGQ